MSEIVLKVEDLWKQYRLGLVNNQTIKDDLQRFWAKLRGKEDPTLKIGEANNRESIKGEYVWALQDINFEVKRGEVLGIIGKNGAGKSTLLKILSKVTSPTKGNIKTKGRIASLLEVGTGFHPELTGRENIFMNGAILGMTKNDIKNKFDEIVEFSGIGKYIDTPVKRYSSGMYVRLAFAVAAHLEPEILIIDEVLAVGDAEFQKKCLGKMKDVSGEGRTVLFVSHNMAAIASLSKRCILLEYGSIRLEGDVNHIIEFYRSNPSQKKQPIKEYPADENKAIQIRKIELRNHINELVSEIEVTQDFNISISYEIRENIQNLSIGLQIISQSTDETIISLSEPELDLSRLDKRNKGYYRSIVKIPRNILNTGDYIIRAGAVRLQQIDDVVEDYVFTIVDNVGIVQPLGYERKNSLLALQLPWEVTTIKNLTIE